MKECGYRQVLHGLKCKTVVYGEEQWKGYSYTMDAILTWGNYQKYDFVTSDNAAMAPEYTCVYFLYYMIMLDIYRKRVSKLKVAKLQLLRAA